MPAQIIHLMIAQKYLEKHKGLPGEIKDETRFFDGNVLPDLDSNKERSHCGVRSEMHDVVKRNLEKVNPQKFRQTHDMTDELNKGQYLHLYVDYQYYNVFLGEKYFRNAGFDQSSKDLFEVTKRDTRYIIDKYKVTHAKTSYNEALEALNQAWFVDHYGRYGRAYAYSYPYSLPELEEFMDKMAETEI